MYDTTSKYMYTTNLSLQITKPSLLNSDKHCSQQLIIKRIYYYSKYV